MDFESDSERQSVDYDRTIVCYQNYLDRTYRCARCADEVLETLTRDFVGPPVLEGRKVFLAAMRVSSCIAARDMVAEFVYLSSGRVADSILDADVRLFVNFEEGRIVLNISDGQKDGGDRGAPQIRHAVWDDAPFAARSAVRLLCEYLATHKSASPKSSGKYRRIERMDANPVVANPEERHDLSGRTIFVWAFPDYAPWLIGVTQTIKHRLSGRGATVTVGLFESTIIRRPPLTSDLDVCLVSARADEREYGPYRARHVLMAYRVIPSRAWATAGDDSGDIHGVADECFISYWPAPPYPAAPNSVESHSVEPVITAVDQVLRQIHFR